MAGSAPPEEQKVLLYQRVCPPHAPTENPTGSSRRSFTVPSSWNENPQLRLGFDEVDSAFHQRMTSWFEFINGIFRDVYLISLPGDARIEDFFVKTLQDKDYKDATLEVSLDFYLQQDVELFLSLTNPTKSNDVVKSENWFPPSRA
ncbi:hypothetical protein DL95DRAFT_462984 [Leptodontidium sp. 2 PMI_412]|nr:hypothetical protein DL95DRAFT_462984 [Leptodontidium sp. 2 PMI_412]